MKTQASKRSSRRRKKPHGNKGQVRPPILKHKPLMKPKLRAKGMSIDDIARMMLPAPDIFNARDVRTITSHRGQSFPKRGKIPKKGNLAVSYMTRTDDDAKDSPRYHRQLIYARDPNYTGRLIDCKQVIFSCDCLPGHTRVLTSEGWKTIYELLDHSVGLDPTKDFPITYIVDGKPYKGSAPFFKGIKKTYKVKLDNGFTLEGTPDHKVLVWTHNEQVNHKTAKRVGIKQAVPQHEWKNIKQLKVGDRLVTNCSDYFEPSDRNQKYYESYFLGMFYGDGTLNPPSITIASHLSTIDIIKKAGVNMTLSKEKNRANTRFLLDRVGKEILKKYGYDKDKYKIPLNKIDVFSFLSGLIDSDGSISVDGRAEITGHESIITLAEELVRIGVHGVKFKAYREKGTKTNLGATTRRSWKVSITAKGMRSISHNLCSIKYSSFTSNVKHFDPESTSKIISIDKKGGKKYVYDIHVPQIHRFVAESIIVHNCARWKFKWEYAMWNRGAAEIRFSNGEPPVITNRRMRPTACKHFYRVRKGLRKRKW